MESILVTAKINPDLDGVACTLAYAELLNLTGSTAEGMIFGSPQSEVSYFIDQHRIAIPTQTDEPSTTWNQFVLVDASSMMGMPQPVIPKQVVEIIDHRAGSEPEKEFPNARIQNELVGAAATLVTERFIQNHLQPSRERALLLYGAIHHNSLNFLATNTSTRDHKAVIFLETEYRFDKKIIEEMFRFATELVAGDITKAIEDDGKEFGKGYTIGAYQLIVWGDDILKKKSELEEVVCTISKDNGEQWALLNIVDVAQGRGFVYVTDNSKISVVAGALGTSFEDGWTTVTPALLRKQIMPRIQNALTSRI